MRNILYLTVPSFFDLEISLIRELSKECNVKVIMIVSPESIHSSAFNIEKILPDCKLYESADYDGFQQYSHLVDPNRWIIANNPDNSIRSCIKLCVLIKKYIKDGCFDLIHSTTDCKTSLFLFPLLWTIKNKLFTTHDPISHHNYSGLGIIRRWLSYDLMFLTYRNLLLLSKSQTKEFVKIYKGKYKNIYYSKLGIYDFLRSLNRERIIKDPYILFFGRIDFYKGVDILIRAYKNSSLPSRNIKLVIAGKGDLTQEMNLIDKNIIVLNRYIENSELASLIKYSLFVVLPYRTVTQSGVLKSAYAFDKPVVATKVGSFIAEIKDGEEGILVNPSDEKDLCRGLEKMACSDLNSFSKRIHLRYSEYGVDGWSAIAHDLVSNVYNKIIQEL